MVHCMEEYLYDGLITSLSHAADCLARKAYFLGKNQEYQSPWMREYEWFTMEEIEVINPAPEGYDFLGGKEDDITVTVAQVFKDVGPDDPRRQLSANDTYYPDQKTLYTRRVPSNKKDGF